MFLERKKHVRTLAKFGIKGLWHLCSSVALFFLITIGDCTLVDILLNNSPTLVVQQMIVRTAAFLLKVMVTCYQMSCFHLAVTENNSVRIISISVTVPKIDLFKV